MASERDKSRQTDGDVPSGPETAAFVRASRDGDSGGFGALYARFHSSLLAWAHLRVRPQFRSLYAPEDLVHDVWLRARTVFESYDPSRSNFRAWLFSVAKLVLFEVQRQLHRQTQDGGGQGHSSRVLAMAQVPADVSAVTQRLARDEAFRVAVERLRSLEDEDRDLLVHCGLEQMTVKDAAVRLGLNLDAAHKRLQRLKERIKAWKLPSDLLLDLES